MRRSCLMLLACSVFSWPALADDIVTTGEVVAATVFTDRAIVTRRAVAKIQQGDHVLILENLPAQFDTNSLRATGVADAAVTLGAVTHKRIASEDYVAPREQALTAQIEELNDQKSRYQDQITALDLSRQFLNKLGDTAALRGNEQIAQIDLNPDAWAAAADGLSSKMAAILKDKHDLTLKIREANRAIQALQNDLNQLRTGGKTRYHVRVPLTAAAATTLTLDLSYQVYNAAWQPLYDARLSTENEALSLVQYGSVWQRTGEDWTDIDLTLSTAQPRRGASVPTLYPHWISFLKPEMRGVAHAEMAMESAVMMADVAAPHGAMKAQKLATPAPVEARFEPAEVQNHGYVADYKITTPATVKSDGSKAKLLIGSIDADVALQTHVKPQVSDKAYLIALTTLKADAPILAGQVNLFRDGSYIGQNRLPMLRPHDVQPLAFGIDERVTVTHNVIDNTQSESGLISKEESVSKQFVTRVKNVYTAPIDLVMQQTIPVSQDKDITVRLVEKQTTAGYKRDVDDKAGVMEWRRKIAPKTEETINLGWTVTWPKGQVVSGL